MGISQGEVDEHNRLDRSRQLSVAIGTKKRRPKMTCVLEFFELKACLQLRSDDSSSDWRGEPVVVVRQGCNAYGQTSDAQ
ncbi:hypothetical protein Q31a_07570 [Aureliella helgolandensis]|uniref:Uncharacterized protein n=1 Tax=Aureliella helgolandensis TaxID=2527968 RepID=A0A518G1K7_9BACT|nr:hypothetical protein Q31a_07570 [Aureliella helgolandensis]